jgi:levansucrase
VTEAASIWSAQHVAAIREGQANAIPLVTRAALAQPLPDYDLWDMWPVQTRDGTIAQIDGWAVWLILSAPIVPDPDKRHDHARIRMMSQRDGDWRDHGDLLPEGINPGSRDWAGSTVYDPDSGRMTIYFTAAGRRDEAQPSFAQRIFSVECKLVVTADALQTTDWSAATECLISDGEMYLIVDEHEGKPGFIKGFRDPAFFEDPAGGQTYLLFTGSVPHSDSAWNGCIGIARGVGDNWQLMPPLMSSNGVNNELERPHIIAKDGRYYLFWSTQRRTFADGGPNGPNGLYGMVADTVTGPYCPLNGSGLVAANPADAPFQTYSWWVTPDLGVAGFVDLIGEDSAQPVDCPTWRRDHFGGVPAPRFQIALDGDRAWVV